MLQVLWCPLDHDPEWMPAARVLWRSSALVDALLTDPPLPSDVTNYGEYVPEPCVLHPETVTEYPAPLELERGLVERIEDWCEREFTGTNPRYRDARAYYQYELSVVPGWKVGGWGPWSFSDPAVVRCTACESVMSPLLMPPAPWTAAAGTPSTTGTASRTSASTSGGATTCSSTIAQPPSNTHTGKSCSRQPAFLPEAPRTGPGGADRAARCSSAPGGQPGPAGVPGVRAGPRRKGLGPAGAAGPDAGAGGRAGLRFGRSVVGGAGAAREALPGEGLAGVGAPEGVA